MVNIHSDRRFVISRKADHFISNLPEKIRIRVKDSVLCLIRGDVGQLDIRPLSPHSHEYRLRIGNVRILFRADKELLFVFKAGFRGDIYKDKKK